MDEDEFELEAARVALVTMFGMVPGYEQVDANRIRIWPDAILTFEKAARLLASMPKPLVCVGENVSGALYVSCELLAERSEAERERFATLRRVSGASGDRGRGGALGGRAGARGSVVRSRRIRSCDIGEIRSGIGIACWRRRWDTFSRGERCHRKWRRSSMRAGGSDDANFSVSSSYILG